MKGQSNIIPETFVQYQGGWQYRYNIAFVEAADDVQQHYDYDYVDVKKIDRGTLIDAVVTDTYSYASQIGKASLPDSSVEKTAYNKFIADVKLMVDTDLNIPYNAPIIEAVTMYQARLALFYAGLLPTIESAIAEIGGEASVIWTTASMVRKDSPLIDMVKLMAGMTDEQIDGLFLAASNIV